ETCTWDGDEDSDTHHFAVLDGDTAVAIGSLYRRSHECAPGDDAWQLRGMATHPEHRGCGLGALVLAEMARYCSDDIGGELLWCNARTSAEGFYLRYGFSTMTPVFEIPQVGPHVVMRRILAG
ncbi:MAG: GNAT family N-acetyltransferase, partial [Phycisphaerales bacterium]|nr:GNAT family N-acetyltransferase [Phycisphaerales bacterium]